MRTESAIPSNQTVVVIAERHRGDLTGKLLEAVQGHLLDLPVALKIEWVESMEESLRSKVRLARQAALRNDAVTVFWADISSPEQIFLYLSHPAGERILIRDLGGENESEASRLETLGIIVRTSVEAILEGGTIGIHPPPREVKETEREIHDWLVLNVAYGLGPLTTGALTHGPNFGLATYIKRRWRIFAGYRFILPEHYTNAGIHLELRPHVIELGSGVKWTWNKLHLFTDLALLANFVTADSTATAGELSAKSPRPDWQLGLGPSMAFAWSPYRFATIFLTITLDIYFNQPEYVVEDVTGFRKVVSPWKVRPFIQIGSAFGLL